MASAWSTNPTLLFHKTPSFASKEQLRNCNKWIDHTLERYSRDNIPMEKFDMFLTFENQQELTSLAEKWSRSLATQPCLKKIFLTIDVKLASFKLPDDILFGENLNEMFIYSSGSLKNMVFMSTNHVIKCVSLRAITLSQVNISDEVLNNIFSVCSLLEKIDLKYCKGFKTIKVKNLHYLCDFIIHQDREKDIFEIDDVPNLRLFDYSSTSRFERVPFNTDSLGSVTYLSVDGLIIDDAFESKFPLLESLTLKMNYMSPESFELTCLSLKRLFIHTAYTSLMITKVQVHAPKLLLFYYDGMSMPSLLFPAIVPKQIHLKLHLLHSINDSCFLKIRETLTLSSEFDIRIAIAKHVPVPLNIDIDGLKRRVLPATNVQKLSVETNSSDWLWEQSPFFDAIFSICHPKHIAACQLFLLQSEQKYFSKLMVREVMKKLTGTNYLKDVEIKNPRNGKWEAVTNSLGSSLEGSPLLDFYKIEFKLNWFSI